MDYIDHELENLFYFYFFIFNFLDEHFFSDKITHALVLVEEELPFEFGLIDK